MMTEAEAAVVRAEFGRDRCYACGESASCEVIIRTPGTAYSTRYTFCSGDGLWVTNLLEESHELSVRAGQQPATEVTQSLSR